MAVVKLHLSRNEQINIAWYEAVTIHLLLWVFRCSVGTIFGVLLLHTETISVT